MKSLSSVFKKKTPSPGEGSFNKKVSSSSVESIAYDADKKVFSITFLNGSTYDYHGVTQKDALLALNSPSYGKVARNELGAYKGVKR